MAAKASKRLGAKLVQKSVRAVLKAYFFRRAEVDRRRRVAQKKR